MAQQSDLRPGGRSDLGEKRTCTRNKEDEVPQFCARQANSLDGKDGVLLEPEPAQE
jgi:hypothetical protein